VSVMAGPNRTVEPSSHAFSVQSVLVDRRAPGLLSAAPSASTEPVRQVSWTVSARVVRVSARQRSFLIVNQNFNSGWQATLHGKVLQPAQLDGWKQGWLLPAGSDGLVTMTYRPDAGYRAALFGGLAALAAVIIVAAWPGRRRRDEMRADRRPTAGRLVSRPGAGWRAGLRLAAGLAACAAAGLWLGGYPGALLLPSGTVLFALAAAFPDKSQVCRIALAPWLAGFLMLAAAVAGALGQHLAEAGADPRLAADLAGLVPQLLCLAIIGRLAAELILPDASVRHPVRDVL
jgi:arabinofuranan 3-O-arabinosyltransferase